MPLLISGPAGGAKSQAARAELANRGLAVAADFQSLYVALTLAERLASGRYPLRDERLLPLTEYVRRTILTGARARGIDVVATNSDGDPDRRQFLLSELGPGAVETVIDPGKEVVIARLGDTDGLSPECDAAIARWYDRL